MIDIKKSIIQAVPTTRYQGSKRKLLPWIKSILDEMEFETVLDAFGGTGSVSYLFKSMGKRVTYNDYLKFNSIIGKSIIENSNTILKEHDVGFILSKAQKTKNFISNFFSEIFFLDHENIWIDNVVNGVKDLNINTYEVLEYKKAIAYNALYQACLIKRPFNLFHRKNLYLRTNNVKRNFGNKKTWDRDFEFYFKKFVAEINLSIFDSGVNCYAQNSDVFDIDNYGYDLVYLDPPYVLKNSRNESANYLKCYHFLEGIANYDIWRENMDLNSKILSLNNTFLKNHFKQSIIHETFEKLIYKFRKCKIVISYKFGGLPSIDFIIGLLEKHNKSVYTHSIHYKYALNKQNGNAKLNREYLIIGI